MEEKRLGKEPPIILIVDDISMNVEILDNIITHEGYKTLCALSVKEAIGLIRQTRPTLILSDLSMPEVDGLEFCRMIKGDPKTRDIPFIFISVLDTSEEKERAFRAGAIDYIPKPFDAVEVVMRVNNQLDSYRLRQEMADYNRKMHKLVEEQKRQQMRERKTMLQAFIKLIKKRNEEMELHLENVSYNSSLLAQGLQFLPEYENEVTDEFVENIRAAAELHEIGGLAMRDDREQKKDIAGERKREDMEKIAEAGAEILEGISVGQNDGSFLPMAVRIVRCQYANFDGTGYPSLTGREIPLEARITAVANDFDILTAEGGCSIEEGIARLKERSGSCYDPDVVSVFGRIWRQMKLRK